MMTLFTIGPVFGTTDYIHRFSNAKNQLSNAGYTVINPTTLPYQNADDWQACMRIDIAAMLQHADGLCLLPNWNERTDAFVQLVLIQHLGMPNNTIWRENSIVFYVLAQYLSIPTNTIYGWLNNANSP